MGKWRLPNPPFGAEIGLWAAFTLSSWHGGSNTG